MFFSFFSPEAARSALIAISRVIAPGKSIHSNETLSRLRLVRLVCRVRQRLFHEKPQPPENGTRPAQRGTCEQSHLPQEFYFS
jgi:hypothetical protein